MKAAGLLLRTHFVCVRMTKLLPAEPRPVRGTSDAKLLNLDTDDKIAAVVIPPENPKFKPENGTLL